MNKVWEELCTGDCSISFNPGSQLDRELLQQSRLITQKMDVLEESLASVQSSVSSLHRTLPTYVRYEIKLDRLEQMTGTSWLTSGSVTLPTPGSRGTGPSQVSPLLRS